MCKLFSIWTETEDKLGAGAYGLVLKGTARGLFSEMNDDEETTVAVKTLQANADITYFKALLMELKIMSVIGRNPYILNLLGACTTGIRNSKLYKARIKSRGRCIHTYLYLCSTFAP